jgi:hypothetical protein
MGVIDEEEYEYRSHQAERQYVQTFLHFRILADRVRLFDVLPVLRVSCCIYQLPHVYNTIHIHQHSVQIEYQTDENILEARERVKTNLNSMTSILTSFRVSKQNATRCYSNQRRSLPSLLIIILFINCILCCFMLFYHPLKKNLREISYNIGYN